MGPVSVRCGLSSVPAARDDGGMHVSLGHALVVAALVASVFLVLERGDRLFPIIALVASGLEALIVYDVISLSARSVRIDVILPAILLLAGGVCWARATTKTPITAASVATLVAAIQLAGALRLLS
jgi:hypothetical protein